MSMSGVTMESTKLLTEKLTITRELSNLKTELDHLRSQATSHQSLLAEKLSLQRQLNTMKVEVENERRSTHRLAVQENKYCAENATNDVKLEAVQAELAKEKRDRQNGDREAKTTSAVLENKIMTYESRLDAFRTKLKSSKDLLKETQLELQKASAANVCAPVLSRPTIRASRKRLASEMDADTMIGTPGDLPAAKRSKATSAMPGDKSTFSITPFLNRTASVAPESLSEDENRNVDEEYKKVAAQSPSVDGQAGPLNYSVSGKSIEKTLCHDNSDVGYITTGIAKAKSKNPVARAAFKKAMNQPALAQVIEEIVEPLKAANAVTAEVIEERTNGNASVADRLEKKRSKRKLLGAGLGKTLFDEDDDVGLRGDGKIGSIRGLGALGKGAIRDFSAFSPLKKDRATGVAR